MNRETIFLFTSERERRTTGNWYAMWVNPESINEPWEYIFNQTQTTKGWTITHWRNKLVQLSIDGQSGWILSPSLLDKLLGDLWSSTKNFKLKPLKYRRTSGFSGGFEGAGIGPRLQKFGKDLFTLLKEGGQITDYELSPRKFIERLELVMKEPMYMEDFDGIEFYNIKYLHAFTKKYPEGIIYKGFATRFNIKETSADLQSINYSFNFLVEDKIKNMTNIINFIKSFVEIGTSVYEGIKKI